jgi:hypothetical protein
LEIIMNAPAQSNHFNLHVNGVGYLNRVRWVEPRRNAGRKADPFLACSVAALRGDSGSPDYTYFDLRISGREAIEMVERLGEDIEAQRKVFISFRVGDIYPHVYEREAKDREGRKTGEKEIASLIKGRLLLINSITIDGQNVYRRDPEADLPDETTPVGDDTAQDSQPGQFDQDVPPQQPASRGQHERQAQPRHQERAQPVARQSQQGRTNDQRPAYRGGYAAGRAFRQGADRVADAMA